MARSAPSRPPRWLRRLAAWLISGSEAEFIVRDLDELARRDVDRGLARWRVVSRYARNSLASAITVARSRLRTPPLPGVSWIDVRLGARMLVKHPALTLVGGLGIAVAIAISAGAVAFFDTMVFSTLPFDEGERIVGLENWDTEINNEHRRSLRDFATWRDEMETVHDLGAFRTVVHNLIGPGGPAEPVEVAEMTASGFHLTRVPPLVGRTLVEEDEREDAEPVVIVGHEFWERRFGADPGLVGTTLRLGGEVYTVAGIMPAGFAFPYDHQFWTALRARPDDYPWGEGPEIFIFGRLAPGATLEEANAELTTIGGRVASAHPEARAHMRPQVLPYAYPLLDINDGGIEETVAAMLITLGLLLTVVCVNVAILVYARTAMRQPEIAIRSALGASRTRIVAQLFVEALLLSGGAAVVGLALARIGVQQAFLLMETEAGTPFWIRYGVSGRTLAYTVALTLLAAVIVGVVPGLQATGRRLRSSVGRIGPATGLRLGRTWTVLVIAQVAFAVGGLPVAVAVGWSEVRFATTTPAFAPGEFVGMRLVLDAQPPPGVDVEAFEREAAARHDEVNREVLRRLAAEPWVAEMTTGSRLLGLGRPARVEIEGGPPGPGASGHAVGFSEVGERYFAVFGAEILQGRTFAGQEHEGGATAVVVNETFAREVLGEGPALGQRLRYVGDAESSEPPTWHEVVGVVTDLHVNALEPELVEPQVYHLLAPEQRRFAGVFLRIVGNTDGIAERLRTVAAAVEPTARVSVIPLEALYRQSQLALRLTALIVGFLLLSVLLLSAAGIYALMSFAVTRRQREIGIRTALGASRRRILTGMFGSAAVQLAFGIGAGVVGLVVLDPLSGGELMAGAGSVLVPGIAALMTVVGLLATLGPARRGLRIQPTDALREE